MSPMKLKMQPIIHWEDKAGFLPLLDPALRSKCIVGCIFIPRASVVIREIPCSVQTNIFYWKLFGL
jgi:hypothetical protein